VAWRWRWWFAARRTENRWIDTAQSRDNRKGLLGQRTSVATLFVWLAPALRSFAMHVDVYRPGPAIFTVKSMHFRQRSSLGTTRSACPLCFALLVYHIPARTQTFKLPIISYVFSCLTGALAVPYGHCRCRQHSRPHPDPHFDHWARMQPLHAEHAFSNVLSGNIHRAARNIIGLSCEDANESRAGWSLSHLGRRYIPHGSQ